MKEILYEKTDKRRLKKTHLEVIDYKKFLFLNKSAIIPYNPTEFESTLKEKGINFKKEIASAKKPGLLGSTDMEFRKDLKKQGLISSRTEKIEYYTISGGVYERLKKKSLQTKKEYETRAKKRKNKVKETPSRKIKTAGTYQHLELKDVTPPLNNTYRSIIGENSIGYEQRKREKKSIKKRHKEEKKKHEFLMVKTHKPKEEIERETQRFLKTLESCGILSEIIRYAEKGKGEDLVLRHRKREHTEDFKRDHCFLNESRRLIKNHKPELENTIKTPIELCNNKTRMPAEVVNLIYELGVKYGYTEKH